WPIVSRRYRLWGIRRRCAIAEIQNQSLPVTKVVNVYNIEIAVVTVGWDVDPLVKTPFCVAIEHSAFRAALCVWWRVGDSGPDNFTRLRYRLRGGGEQAHGLKGCCILCHTHPVHFFVFCHGIREARNGSVL